MSKFYDFENIYKTDTKLKKGDIKILMEWLKKQPHLPQISEDLTILFLHSCYYNLELAKITIDNHFTTRTFCPEIFRFQGLAQIKQAALVTYLGVLPEKTLENYNVIFCCFIDSNSESFRLTEQANFFEHIAIMCLLQDGPPDGWVGILDARGASLGHLIKFSSVSFIKYVYYIQEAAPVRIREIHIINANSIAEKIFGIVKAFIKADIVKLIYIHKNTEGVFDYVPQKLLPKEYGGEAPSVHDLQKKNLKNMEKYAEKFYFFNSLTVDESKRPGKPKTAGDLFGVDGTFKKLELD